MITKGLTLRKIYRYIKKIPTLVWIISIIIAIFKILFLVALIIIILQPTKYQWIILKLQSIYA